MVSGLGNLVIKEVKEMARDPKILLPMVVMPLIIFPLMGVAMNISTTAMEESLKRRVTRTVNAAVWLIWPASTTAPGIAGIGTDSPVRTDVSSCETPDTTSPSRGTFSPGFMRMISPMPTDSGVVSVYPSGD